MSKYHRHWWFTAKRRFAWKPRMGYYSGDVPSAGLLDYAEMRWIYVTWLWFGAAFAWYSNTEEKS